MKNIINFIKKIVKNNPSTFGLAWRIYYRYKKRKLDKKSNNYLLKRFKKKFNYIPNLNNPITFNEKLLYLKLFHYNEKWSCLSDKYEVRKYLSSLNLSHLLVENYGVYNSFNEISFENLPNKFIIKCTHGSHMNIICDDKTKLNMKKTKKILNTWLGINYHYNGGEWVYKNLKHRIIIDKYIEDFEHGEIFDYRVFCFNGKAHHIHVDYDVDSSYSRVIYDKYWNKLDFSYARHNVLGKYIEKPKLLDDLIHFSEILSKNIPFVRVDFYIVKNKIYFGEMTFFPSGGYGKFYPHEMDIEYGSLLKIENNEFTI
jgi:hypothetical protein